jgi:predicted metal-dependent hydrolase
MAVAAVPYTLRHSPRSRRLRITIDPDLGLVVTVPPPTRRGWARPEARITAFLAERDAWIRRHLDSLVRDRAELAARGGLRDGALIRYRGELHRLRIVSGRGRRSTVARVGGEDGDELVVTTAGRDREATADRIARVLEEWLRDRARVAIDEAVVRHAAALGVRPRRVDLRDPRSRWGSASREGRLMLSWRLILAPPEALETVVVHELAHLRVFGHGATFWALVAGRRPDHQVWRRWLRSHSVELHGALTIDAPVGGGLREGPLQTGGVLPSALDQRQRAGRCARATGS